GKPPTAWRAWTPNDAAARESATVSYGCRSNSSRRTRTSTTCCRHSTRRGQQHTVTQHTVTLDKDSVRDQASVHAFASEFQLNRDDMLTRVLSLIVPVLVVGASLESNALSARDHIHDLDGFSDAQLLQDLIDEIDDILQGHDPNEIVDEDTVGDVIDALEDDGDT